jgi:hypothetical protein
LAASSSTAPGTSHASGRLVTAREYINAIEKYMKGGVLSAAELEDALYAQHLSHQANIIAEHPTYRPWKLDIHLANVIASKRMSSAG